MELGKSALEIGDFKRSEIYFARVLDKNPKSKEARYGSALSLYGIAEEEERTGHSNTNSWQKSYDEFRILLKTDSSKDIFPMYSNCLFYLAKASLFENPKADVLPLLLRSVQLDSSNYFSMNLQALLYESYGNETLAEETFVYIISKFPKFAEAYINLGSMYWKKRRFEDAWDIWSMGLEELPKNADLSKWTRIAEDSLYTRAMQDSAEAF